MRLVGLTGGIGSGKSTVSSLLAERGAVIIDADAVVRELQEPGQPVFEAMVARWGRGIVLADEKAGPGWVASIVFDDADELDSWKPSCTRRFDPRCNEGSPNSARPNVVVLDMALLTEKENPYDATEIIVVDLAPDAAVDRLVRLRGFSVEDAERRIAAQTSRGNVWPSPTTSSTTPAIWRI